MSKWTFAHSNQILAEAPPDQFGFVYQITHVASNNFYIGCKGFFSITNPKISKKRATEIYTGKGPKKKREQKVKESNWKTYISSSKELQAMITEYGINAFKYEILAICNTKQHMLLLEASVISSYFLSCNANIINKWVSVKSFKPC